MSGASIISPTTIDTTLEQDAQPPGSITAADVRQANDSLSGLFTSQQAGNYTFALVDRGTQVESTSATALTWTVPPTASIPFQPFTQISWRQHGAGQITFAPGAGVTILTSSSLTSRAQNSSGTLQLSQVTDVWNISGDLT